MIKNIGAKDLGVSYENFSWNGFQKIVALVEMSKGFSEGDGCIKMSLY